jgi:adenosine deaminase
VAHTGEVGPPAYIWEALNDLRTERIDHGVRSLEDPVLVAELAKRRTPLTVCPLSNLKLCVVNDLKDHPMKRLLDAGLCATVNSDDPAYFGGYMNANFVQTVEALGLTSDDVITLARNSFEASFVSEARRAELMAALDGAIAV